MPDVLFPLSGRGAGVMAEVKLNFAQYDEMLANASLDRMMTAAGVLQTNMILKCKKSYTNRRPVYKKGPYAGQIYTARDMDIMAKTIRVVSKKVGGLHGKINVRVYAGNFKTWWALQMEYGRGAWKGGAQPFMRPAISGSKSQIQVVLETGHGETR
jgi:hypothetical protein